MKRIPRQDPQQLTDREIGRQVVQLQDEIDELTRDITRLGKAIDSTHDEPVKQTALRHTWSTKLRRRIVSRQKRLDRLSALADEIAARQNTK